MPATPTTARGAATPLLAQPPLASPTPRTPQHSHPQGSHQFSMYGLSPVVIAVVSSVAWMAVSSGLIMLNKKLLSSGFPYPMTLSGLGMAFSGFASYITCRHLRLVEATRTVTGHFWTTKILPVGLFMALTLACGNLVYLYLSVAFIQILKSFTPIITMVALFLAGLETPTRRLVASVLLIATGTALASVGELNFSLIGVGIMLAAESFEALRLVATQMLLTGLKFHPIEGLMYLAPAATLWLTLGSLFFESRSIFSNGGLAVVASKPFHFVLAALLGFFVNSLAYIVIQTASSLTLKVLATVKNVLVVCLGVFLLGETVTPLQAVGYAMSLAAFTWYQRIKMQQIAEGQGAGTKEVSLTQRNGGNNYVSVPTKDYDGGGGGGGGVEQGAQSTPVARGDSAEGISQRV